jgi:predicted Ser/Thr protein kinase
MNKIVKKSKSPFILKKMKKSKSPFLRPLNIPNNLIKDVSIKKLHLNKKCCYEYQSGDDFLKIIENCFGNAKVNAKIGQGSFGTLYHITINGKSTAVKIIKLNSNKELLNFTEEIKLSGYMGDLGIGPKVYDSFYIKTIRENKYIQIINMELFEGDMSKFYSNLENVPIELIKSATRQMLTLVDGITSSGFTCVDLKPGNFVYKYTEKTIVVKMIDFGMDYCEGDNKYTTELDKIITNIILKMQIFYIIMFRKMDIKKKKEINNIFNNFIFKKRNIPKKSPKYGGGHLPAIIIKNEQDLQTFIKHVLETTKKIPRLSTVVNWYLFGNTAPLQTNKWYNLLGKFFDDLKTIRVSDSLKSVDSFSL